MFGFIGSPSYVSGETIADQQYAIVRGSYASGQFTQSAGGADSMIIWDGDLSIGGLSATALVLQNVTAVTQHNVGQIII